MPNLQTIAVNSPGAFKAFLRLPWTIYADDPRWVPPLLRERRRLLEPERHPCWEDFERQLFLVRRGSEAVGRIAAISPGTRKEGTGFFGFFEAVDDPEVFDALFAAASRWLRGRGLQRAIGPVNPSLHYSLGTLVRGFDLSPYLMTTHNPAYYPDRIEACGLEKERDFLCYRVPTKNLKLPQRLRRAGRFAERRYGLRVRSANMRRFREELNTLGRVYNLAFADHWGFTPMNRGEIERLGDDLRPIIDPDLVLFAERRGQTVGFLLAVPNINEILRHNRSGRTFPDAVWRLLWGKRHIQSFRLMTVGVLPEYRHLGVIALLYREIVRRTVSKPRYREVELSWVLDSNRAVHRAAGLFPSEPVKRYRLYRLPLVEGQTRGKL